MTGQTRKGFDDLRPRQRDAIKFIHEHPFCALWVDMGEGKTVVSWTVIRDLLENDFDGKVLIVAPIKVAVQTWPGELDEWRHLAKLKNDFTVLRPTGQEPEVSAARERSRQACDVLNLRGAMKTNIVKRAETRGEEAARRRLARSATRVHIVNREMVPWLVWYWGAKWPYRMVVYDESSGLRSHQSDRFRALARVRKYITRLVELTGTPKPETYMDVFPQIWLLDKGERLGSNITRYRKRWFSYHEPTRKYQIKKGAADLIIRRIADLVLVQQNLSGEHEPLLLDRSIQLTPDERQLYDAFERTAVLDLPDFYVQGDTAGALAQKLLQFASGAVYDADRNWRVIHNHKIEALRQIAEEAMGTPLLVAYWHQSSLARLKRAFNSGRALDKEGHLQHAWNRGEIPYMFVHPASAGHGLNLQKGPGHTLVFFDIPYPLELYLQIIKRLARPGQKQQVRVYHLTAGGTIDEGIVPLLKRKQSSQEYLMQRVAAIRRAGT